MSEHILSLSYGKDSLACLGAIEQLGWPLDRIVHAEVWATEEKQAEGLAISQAIVYGHCDKCGFLPQCSTQGEAFQFPVFAWCMRRKEEILRDLSRPPEGEEDT